MVRSRPFAGLLLLAVAAGPALAAGGETALAVSPADQGLTWNPCPAFMPAGCGIAVLHGDPAQPNADVFFKVPAGAQIPRHHHTSAERMVLVAGELEVQYEGQAPVTLRRGDYAYGPPGHVHSGRCAEGADCILFIAFEQPVDALADPVAADGAESGSARPAR